MIHYDINIDPKEWGPYFWHTMEIIACTLNIKNKNQIYLFFDNLRHILPCEKCRDHYNLYFKENDINDYMDNCLTLLLWLYKLKKIIKIRQKSEIIPSFYDYLLYIMNKFDMPEIQYHMDKNMEFKNYINKNSLLEKRYHLKEYFELINNQNTNE